MSWFRLGLVALAPALVGLVVFTDDTRAHDDFCDERLAPRPPHPPPAPRPYRVRVETAPDGTPTLNFSGELPPDHNFANRFRDALTQMPRGGRVLVVLDGAGGSFSSHRAVAALIQAHFRGHLLRRGRNARITTYVPAGGACVADCLRLFMLGDERLAHPTAHFGFRRAVGLGRVGRTVRELRSWGLRGPLVHRLQRAGAFEDPKRVTLVTAAGAADSNLLTAALVDLGVPRLSE